MIEPCWAILVPANAEKLAGLLSQIAGSEMLSHHRVLNRISVVEGKGTYSAVVDMTPGSEGSGDEELAATLSARISGSHFLLWFQNDWESGWIFEAGRRLNKLEESPWVIVEEKKIELPGKPLPLPPVGTVCVVENASMEQVAEVIGAQSSSIMLEPTAIGTVILDLGGKTVSFAPEISEKLNVRVYSVFYFLDEGIFTVCVSARGKVIGCFTRPDSNATDFPVLSSILGQDTPDKILHALGLSWSYLDPTRRREE